MVKALGFGAILQSLIIIVTLSIGKFDQVGNYSEYLAFGLITLGGFMVYNTLRVPSPYYQEDTAEDHKSRWRWTLYFLLASVPSAAFALIFFIFFD